MGIKTANFTIVLNIKSPSHNRLQQQWILIVLVPSYWNFLAKRCLWLLQWTSIQRATTDTSLKTHILNISEKKTCWHAASLLFSHICNSYICVTNRYSELPRSSAFFYSACNTTGSISFVNCNTVCVLYHCSVTSETPFTSKTYDVTLS